MAPKIFLKRFKRKKGQPPKCEMEEQCPDAIGISDSTCEINGDIFNRWKLPIPPPEQRLRKIGSRKRNSQDQSLFFRLPAEIRRMIYLELMGYRRVHIRHVWKEPSPFRPQPEYRGFRWDWWHSVCYHSDGFPQEPDYDLCRDWRSEADRNEKNPKINGVEWLRSCQIGYEEAVEVLYKTNVFAMSRALDTPFLMSRLFSLRCASFITSMDISFPVGFCGPGDDENDWMTTYVAFFDLFGETFHGVHRLRLELQMLPYEPLAKRFDHERLSMFLLPLEKLSQDREWTQLQLCVPKTWRSHFEKSKEMMPCPARWELTETIWSYPW